MILPDRTKYPLKCWMFSLTISPFLFILFNQIRGVLLFEFVTMLILYSIACSLPTLIIVLIIHYLLWKSEWPVWKIKTILNVAVILGIVITFYWVGISPIDKLLWIYIPTTIAASMLFKLRPTTGVDD